MERVTTNLLEATAAGMQDVRGELQRLESNHDTQKKYFVAEIGRVEGIAESAKETATGVQDQLSSVRQQTHDMHNSLTAMQRHSEQLTKGLQDVMVGFREMNFDMPTKFDNWLKVRLGHEGGLPSTISGEDLRRQWNSNQPFPPPPPQIEPLPAPTQPARIPHDNSADQTTESDADGAAHSSRPSSTELYRAYLNPQSSQDSLLQDINLVVDFVSNEETAMDVDGPGDLGGGWDSGAKDASGEAGDVATGANLVEETEEAEILEERQPLVANTGGEQEREPVQNTPSIIPSNATVEGPLHDDATANRDVAPMEPFSAPSPISPNIVRSTSVEPPAGLLARDVQTPPPSSQPTIPSPTPQPARHLLAVPTANVGTTGPITRSRSRSRSVSIPPPELATSRRGG